MIIDQNRVEEYRLKINDITKYQKEANKYKRRAIIGGIFTGANTLLSVYSLIMGSATGKLNNGFVGFLLHAALMSLGFTYMYEMKDNKRDCEQKVAELKTEIQGYKQK